MYVTLHFVHDRNAVQGKCMNKAVMKIIGFPRFQLSETEFSFFYI